MPDKLSSSAEQIPARRPDAQPSLAEWARRKTARWRASLAQLEPWPPGIDDAALTRAIARAGRAMVSRVGLAMLHEGILQPDLGEGGEARMAVPGPDGEDRVLLLRGLGPDSPSLFPQLRLFRAQGDEAEARPIEELAELLELAASAFGEASFETLVRLVEELTDAQLNQALCDSYRAGWNGRIRDSASASGAATFWDWLAGQPRASMPMVLLEQWGATGHPYHPAHKTRRAMTPKEVLAYCPEFEPAVPVRLAAARRERVCGETLPGGPPIASWLKHHFPDQAEAWRNGLTEQGRDPEDYIPLPIHPWQAQHSIPQRFAASLARDDLVLLDAPTIMGAPLVSVRTLAPMGMPDAPHLKLALGMRLTSVERTISPRSCEMGPRISNLLQQLVARDGVLSSSLRIAPEEAGMYFASAVPEEKEESRQLSALLRRNPSRLCADDEIAVPATALTGISPLTGAPLFVELAEAGGGAGAEAVEKHFSHYAETFLRPLLMLYLRYGIGIEAHQQNTLAVYSHAGALRGFVHRDFGGIRIHEASLRRAGLDLEVHPDRLTVVDDFSSVRSKLVSRGLHRHIGFLIASTCRHLRCNERPFWSAVADILQSAFDDLRGEVPAQTWRQERTAFLDDGWYLKANLRMRLENVSKDIYVQTPNPLRRAR